MGALCHACVIPVPSSSRATRLPVKRGQKRKDLLLDAQQLPGAGAGGLMVVLVTAGTSLLSLEKCLSLSRDLPCAPCPPEIQWILTSPLLPVWGVRFPGTGRGTPQCSEEGEGRPSSTPRWCQRTQQYWELSVNYPVLSLPCEWGSLLLIFRLKVYIRRGRGYKAVEELG